MKNLNLINKYKWWITSACALFVLLIINQYFHATPPPTKAEEPVEISTFIPQGYRLVPIQAANYKSLDQILGNYGVVDLYIRTLYGSKTSMQLIGTGIRAIRAKNGSESIGLLVPKEQVKNLLNHTGDYILTINNLQNSGTEFVNHTSQKSKSRIVFAQ